MRQQIRDGSARTKPDFIRVTSNRLVQQKERILENEIGARHQQQRGSLRR